NQDNVLALTAPELQCTGARTFWVEMFYQPGQVLNAGQSPEDDLLQEIQAVHVGEAEPSGPLSKIPQPLYFQSLPSVGVTVECPPPPIEQIEVNVTFGPL
ncbi:MAG: hypothetical protein GWN58_26740, partial [Anaerolineae bacterium]|nr:hypothetical protein [Anaerolineae bacterium]